MGPINETPLRLVLAWHIAVREACVNARGALEVLQLGVSPDPLIIARGQLRRDSMLCELAQPLRGEASLFAACGQPP